MSTILFAWELGAGMGHLLPHREVLAALCARGHTLHVAARDLGRAGRAFADLPVLCWQSPLPLRRPERQFNPTRSFAHVLHNVGFDDVDDLAARIGAWRNILRSVAPDLVMIDYSPTALLALRDAAVSTVLIGTGFTIPPGHAPLDPFLRFASESDRGQLAEDENRLRDAVNAALGRHALPPLKTGIGELFCGQSETVLRTYPELDHSPGRRGGTYWGLPPEHGGIPVRWPEGTRRRAYAYLKPFPVLDALLELLNKLQLPAVVVSDGIPPDVQQRCASGTLRFEQSPVDLEQAARECWLGITNANHATTARLLLAGKPVLMIPRTLEQEILALRVSKLGAGLSVRPDQPRDVYEKLAEMLNSDACLEAAGHFAARNSECSGYVERLVGRIEELLTSRS